MHDLVGINAYLGTDFRLKFLNNKFDVVPLILEILNSLFDILFSHKTVKNYGGIPLIYGINSAFQGLDI
jgi:hypothetical protein